MSRLFTSRAGHRLHIAFGVSLFVLVALQAVTLAGSRLTASAAATPGGPVSRTESGSPSETAPCRPGSGWIWAYGPALPQASAAGQEALLRAGIEGTVAARGFGETDSCGSFLLKEVDIAVSVSSGEAYAEAEQQKLANDIATLLSDLGKPKLGRVEVRFLSDGSVFLVETADTMAARRVDSRDAAQVEDVSPKGSPASQPPPGALERRVYVIVYDPILRNGQNLSDYLGWRDHATLTQGTSDFFRQASHDQVHYRVVETTVITDGWPEKIDGFRYSEDEYLSVLRGERPAHSPDGVDYNSIVNSPALDICGKANSGAVDEVWIYNGPYFGFYESTLVGPDAYWFNSPPVPGPHDCNQLIPIMGPSPERELDCATENFGHRTESTMMQAYGSWEQNRTWHSWDRFALVQALSPDYFYSGCGSIHYPPNGQSDYDYGNLSSVPSNCGDFANYPNLGDPSQTAMPLSCLPWDCDQLQYFGYWYSHFPHNAGCGPDGFSSNWWHYFASPELALHPWSPCGTEHRFVPFVAR